MRERLHWHTGQCRTRQKWASRSRRAVSPVSGVVTQPKRRTPHNRPYGPRSARNRQRLRRSRPRRQTGRGERPKARPWGCSRLGHLGLTNRANRHCKRYDLRTWKQRQRLPWKTLVLWTSETHDSGVFLFMRQIPRKAAPLLGYSRFPPARVIP